MLWCDGLDFGVLAKFDIWARGYGRTYGHSNRRLTVFRLLQTDCSSPPDRDLTSLSDFWFLGRLLQHCAGRGRQARVSVALEHLQRLRTWQNSEV